MRLAACGCFKGMLVGRGIYFFYCKVGHSLSHRNPKGHSAAACCSHQRLVWFCSRLKYSSTHLASGTVSLGESRITGTCRKFETYGPEQMTKNRARIERHMMEGRTNMAHLFADQPELLSAPRVRAKLPLNWNTWRPLKHMHPMQQIGFCSSPANEAALSESHLDTLCAHTSRPLTTPSPLSSSLLIARCHDDHNDTRIRCRGCGATGGGWERTVCMF